MTFVEASGTSESPPLRVAPAVARAVGVRYLVGSRVWEIRKEGGRTYATMFKGMGWVGRR